MVTAGTDETDGSRAAACLRVDVLDVDGAVGLGLRIAVQAAGHRVLLLRGEHQAVPAEDGEADECVAPVQVKGWSRPSPSRVLGATRGYWLQPPDEGRNDVPPTSELAYGAAHGGR